MTAQSTTGEIPNPVFTELEELRDAVRRTAMAHSGQLDRAHRLMHGDRVWSGTRLADAFGAELDGRRDELSRLFIELIEEIEHELRTTPRTTTTSPETWL